MKSTLHLLVHCQIYSTARATLLNDINSISSNLTQLPEIDMVNILLYSGAQLNESQNKTILSARIQFIITSEGFNGPLLIDTKGKVFLCWFQYLMFLILDTVHLVSFYCISYAIVCTVCIILQ